MPLSKTRRHRLLVFFDVCYSGVETKEDLSNGRIVKQFASFLAGGFLLLDFSLCLRRAAGQLEFQRHWPRELLTQDALNLLDSAVALA